MTGSRDEPLRGWVATCACCAASGLSSYDCTFAVLDLGDDIDELPDRLTILHDFDLSRCERLRTLTEYLTVKDTLTLPRRLTSLAHSFAGSVRVHG